MEELSGAGEVTVTISEAEPGSVVIGLTGELDSSDADEVRRMVEEVIDAQPKGVIFDLSGLSFIDSSGVSILILAANKVPQVVVRNPSTIVRRVLDVTGLSGRFQIS